MKSEFYTMRWKDGKPKAVTLSYDDGVDGDKELISLLKKYNMKCTFNINSGLYSEEGATRNPEWFFFRLPKSEATALYNDPHCEVACHGLEHGFFDKTPDAEAIYQVVADRRNLEEQFGTIVTGMAYPYGTYSERTVEILKMCGISYCRTVRSTYSFDIPKNWLTLDPTCHHTEVEKLKELTEKFISTDVKRDGNPLLFYLWGHTFEFVRDNNWDVIENFCKKVSDKDDTWYATNIEIYNYVKAFEALQFNAAFNKVYNPTATDVWINHCNSEETVKIPAGETVCL